MVNPFLKDLCLTNTEAGAAVKTVGTVATIAGISLATGLLTRMGLGRALWIFGVAQAAANLLYAAAALSRHAPLQAALCGAAPAVDAATRLWIYAGIAGEQGAQAMASVAQGALLLRICDRQHAATQFALLSCLFALGRWGAGLPSGFLVEALGYPVFFTVCATVMALPGFFFLHRIAPFGAREVAVPESGRDRAARLTTARANGARGTVGSGDAETASGSRSASRPKARGLGVTSTAAAARRAAPARGRVAAAPDRAPAPRRGRRATRPASAAGRSRGASGRRTAPPRPRGRTGRRRPGGPTTRRAWASPGG